MLRDYQQRSIDQLYDWMRKAKGNACLELPTGAGKSHIVAALCKDALHNWPETRILMMTHIKELIEQNAEKMRLHWPNAPLGIYSAGIGKRQLGEPITFAGIQSIRTRADDIGHIDLCIIDECHLVSHKHEGGYRKLIDALIAINPAMRVVGLTATPYRLGHGLITDKPAIFDAILAPVTIEELIHKKYLAPLRSKITKATLDTGGVHKRGGEFIESELQAAVDTYDNNSAVVAEVIARAEDRKAWLFFCAGVQHAEHIRDELLANGIAAETVTGATPKTERARILNSFKAGKIRALTNCDVLTTGFDYPDIDLIAMLRPTMSASLYVQMAGRGLRPKSHTDHCLVLDFAGNISTHGPITAVKPPDRKEKKEGVAPVKVCPECDELVHISAKTCPACGFEFPAAEKPPLALHDDDIMGRHGTEMAVTSWAWRKHTARESGKEMAKVTYYGGLADAPITEYLTICHGGYAGSKALEKLALIARMSDIQLSQDDTLDSLVSRMEAGNPPASIEYRKTGKFHEIIRREWQ